MNPASIIRRRIEAITPARSMMFRCSFSRRRSMKRYFSRMSSGNFSSPATCIGSTSAADCTTRSLTRSSISPVGRRGFTVPSSRFTTSPVTVITLSGRTASAAANAGEPLANTHWVMP